MPKRWCKTCHGYAWTGLLPDRWPFNRWWPDLCTRPCAACNGTGTMPIPRHLTPVPPPPPPPPAH